MLRSLRDSGTDGGRVSPTRLAGPERNIPTSVYRVVRPNSSALGRRGFGLVLGTTPPRVPYGCLVRPPRFSSPGGFGNPREPPAREAPSQDLVAAPDAPPTLPSGWTRPRPTTSFLACFLGPSPGRFHSPNINQPGSGAGPVLPGESERSQGEATHSQLEPVRNRPPAGSRSPAGFPSSRSSPNVRGD
jgi:hypothetical protein